MRFRMIDLTGQRFGRLVVERIADTRIADRAAWLCRCDCGNAKVIRPQFLTKGKSKSCGCLKAEKLALGMYRTHGMSRSTTYRTWESMWGRCARDTDPAYKYYGGRGICVCERWGTFEAFLADMGKRPAGKTLDRYPDKDGNYEPGNCRWATPKEQANNTGWNRTVTYQGRLLTSRELSDETGIPYELLRERLFKYGWPVDRAINPGSFSTKLSDDDVRAIRSDPRSGAQVAASFGVSAQQANRIRRGASRGGVA